MPQIIIGDTNYDEDALRDAARCSWLGLHANKCASKAGTKESFNI